MAESSSSPLLKVVNLRVVYNGAVVALTHVDLDVRRQDFVALLGANGAGKTTVLRAVSNLLQAVRGQARADVARFDGADILDLGPGGLVRRGLVPVLEGRRVFGPLTVEENSDRRLDRSRKVAGRKPRETSNASTRSFPSSASAGARPQDSPRAASSRCSRSVARLWPNRGCSPWTSRRWASLRSSSRTSSGP